MRGAGGLLSGCLPAGSPEEEEGGSTSASDPLLTRTQLQYSRLLPCSQQTISTTPSMCSIEDAKTQSGEGNSYLHAGETLLLRQQAGLSKLSSVSRLCTLVVCALIVGILSTTLVLYHLLVPSTCTTLSCVRASADLVQRMDINVPPCDDFYRYACGGWTNTSDSPMPPQQTWHTIAEAGFMAYDKLSKTIEKIRSKQLAYALSKGEEAVVDVYTQCMDTETLGRRGLQSWRQFVQKVGFWRLDEPATEDLLTTPRVLEDLMLSAYSSAAYPLFWVGVDVNYLNSKEYVITIDEQLPLLIYAEYYMMDKKEVTVESVLSGDINQLLKFLQEAGLHMATLAGLDRNDERVQISLAQAMVLEWRLVLISSVHEGKGKQHQIYNVTSIEELKRTVPVFDWDYFFSNILGYSLSSEEKVVIKAGSRWLSKLSQLLEHYLSTPEGVKTLENYIKWKSLFLQLSYVKQNCNGSDSNQTFDLLLQMYVGPSSLRRQFCILRSSGHFPLSTTALLRRTEQEDAKENRDLINKMFGDVRTEYASALERSTILDTHTKKHVLHKLGNMSVFAAYPDAMDNIAELNKEAENFFSSDGDNDDFFWNMVRAAGRKYRRDLQRLSRRVDPSEWVDNFNGLSLNAIHNYERNAVLYPLALARDSFIDHNQPSLVNYAGVGFFLGHEMTHAFDSSGRFYGTTGNLGIYWTEESVEKFEQETECLVKQYGTLGGKTEDLKTSTKTLYENVADNIGLQMAFEAFLVNNDLGNSLLPGIQLTPIQSFFVSYAQNWCAKPGGQLSPNVHSEEELRVLGPLQNLPAFAEAFSCPVNSVMNPAKRCTVF